MTNRNTPSDDHMLPPWLRGIDAEEQPIAAEGSISQQFLSAADDLPETIETEMTYDQWHAIQREAKREKSIEEEVPEFDLDFDSPDSTGRSSSGTGAFGTGTLSTGTGPLNQTGELPDWFLGLESLDTSDAPEWFNSSATMPFADTGALNVLRNAEAPPAPDTQPLNALPPWMRDMVTDDASPAEPARIEPPPVDTSRFESVLKPRSLTRPPAAPPVPAASIDSMFSSMAFEQDDGSAENLFAEDVPPDQGAFQQDDALDDFFSSFGQPPRAASPPAPPPPAPTPSRGASPSRGPSSLPTTMILSDDDELPDFDAIQRSPTTRILSPDAPTGLTADWTSYDADDSWADAPNAGDELPAWDAFAAVQPPRPTVPSRSYDAEEQAPAWSETPQWNEAPSWDTFAAPQAASAGYDFDFPEAGTSDTSPTASYDFDFPEDSASNAAPAASHDFDLPPAPAVRAAPSNNFDFDPFTLDSVRNSAAPPSADSLIEEPDLDLILKRPAPPVSPAPAAPADDRLDPTAGDDGETMNWLAELQGIVSAVTDDAPPNFSIDDSIMSAGTVRVSTDALRVKPRDTNTLKSGEFDWGAIGLDLDDMQSQAASEAGETADTPDWLSSVGGAVSTPPARGGSPSAGTPLAPEPATAPPPTEGPSLLNRRVRPPPLSPAPPMAPTMPLGPASAPTSMRPPTAVQNLTSAPLDQAAASSGWGESANAAGFTDVTFSDEFTAFDDAANASSSFDAIDFNLFEEGSDPKPPGALGAPASPSPLDTWGGLGSLSFDDLVPKAAEPAAQSADTSEDAYASFDWDDLVVSEENSSSRRAPAANPVSVTSDGDLAALLSDLAISPPDSAPLSARTSVGDSDSLDSAWMMEDLFNDAPAVRAAAPPASDTWVDSYAPPAPDAWADPYAPLDMGARANLNAEPADAAIGDMEWLTDDLFSDSSELSAAPGLAAEADDELPDDTVWNTAPLSAPARTPSSWPNATSSEANLGQADSKQANLDKPSVYRAISVPDSAPLRETISQDASEDEWAALLGSLTDPSAGTDVNTAPVQENEAAYDPDDWMPRASASDEASSWQSESLYDADGPAEADSALDWMAELGVPAPAPSSADPLRMNTGALNALFGSDEDADSDAVFGHSAASDTVSALSIQDAAGDADFNGEQTLQFGDAGAFERSFGFADDDAAPEAEPPDFIPVPAPRAAPRLRAWTNRLLSLRDEEDDHVEN